MMNTYINGKEVQEGAWIFWETVKTWSRRENRPVDVEDETQLPGKIQKTRCWKY